MSSRSASPTPSNSSAGSSAGGADEDGAARLAQLEALLGASLGYGEPADEPAPAAEERPKKKRKDDTTTNEEPSVAPAASGAGESGPVEMG